MKKAPPVKNPYEGRKPGFHAFAHEHKGQDPLKPVFNKAWNVMYLYGYAWDVRKFRSLLIIEMYCFRFYNPKLPNQHLVSPGRYHHFRRIVDMIWNHKDSPVHFDWQIYSEKMADAASNWDYLAVAGAASTGKSDFAAVYALVQMFCDPQETLVIITSTSLQGAKKRVWASVKKYFQALPPNAVCFKLVDSQGMIQCTLPGSTDQMGATLVAADTSKGSEASAKLIGLKNTRVILIADELSELADSVLKAVDNLAKNPYFQLIGLSNPKSRFDPMGELAEPMDGWDSINIETLEWATKLGYAIRLDGKESPNLTEGQTVYPYLLTQAQWDAAIVRGGAAGENAPGFLRMTRGWFPDSLSESAIFSQADFDYSKAWDKAVWGVEAPTKVAGFDPSFEGGDRCVLVFGKFGKDIHGRHVFEKTETLLLSSDETDKTVPSSHQICNQVKAECQKRGVQSRHFAMDTTGAGGPMADTLGVLWSNDFMRVKFGERPSDRPMSPIDPTPAKDAVDRKVSELWLAGVDLLRAGQVKGVDKELAKELSARYYAHNSGAKRAIETKRDMKKRTGYSPDIADAWCVMLELVRARLRMTSKTKGGQSIGGTEAPWKKHVSKYSGALTTATLVAD